MIPSVGAVGFLAGYMSGPVLDFPASLRGFMARAIVVFLIGAFILWRLPEIRAMLNVIGGG